jgi:hypothetical protein
MADPERAASREHDGIRGKRSLELPEALAAEVDTGKLLPTPTTQDGANNGGPSQFDRNSLPLNAAAKLLPTPTAGTGGDGERPDGYRRLLGPEMKRMTDDKLLPTPTNQQGRNSTSNRPENSQHHSGDTLIDAVWQTHGAPEWAKIKEGSAPAVDDSLSSAWGVYESAVARWTAVFGRQPPPPTDAKGRLSPDFVEWMLGLPHGWTAVPGVTRTARLRMLGNSVQVQVGTRVGSALHALDRELA